MHYFYTKGCTEYHMFCHSLLRSLVARLSDVSGSQPVGLRCDKGCHCRIDGMKCVLIITPLIC